MPRLLLRRPSRRQVPARVASPSTKKVEREIGLLLALRRPRRADRRDPRTVGTARDHGDDRPHPIHPRPARAPDRAGGRCIRRGSLRQRLPRGARGRLRPPYPERARARHPYPKLALLEGLYSDLGLTGRPKQLATPAWPTHLYLGISELRHADLDSGSTGQELDASLKLAVDIIMPPHRAA